MAAAALTDTDEWVRSHSLQVVGREQCPEAFELLAQIGLGEAGRQVGDGLEQYLAARALSLAAYGNAELTRSASSVLEIAAGRLRARAESAGASPMVSTRARHLTALLEWLAEGKVRLLAATDYDAISWCGSPARYAAARQSLLDGAFTFFSAAETRSPHGMAMIEGANSPHRRVPVLRGPNGAVGQSCFNGAGVILEANPILTEDYFGLVHELTHAQRGLDAASRPELSTSVWIERDVLDALVIDESAACFGEIRSRLEVRQSTRRLQLGLNVPEPHAVGTVIDFLEQSGREPFRQALIRDIRRGALAPSDGEPYIERYRGLIERVRQAKELEVRWDLLRPE